MARVKIADTTAEAWSPAFAVNKNGETFTTTGTYASGEDATLQIYNGSAWVNVIVEGTTQVLDEQNTVLTIYGRGTYRFHKEATASAAGVVSVGV